MKGELRKRILGLATLAFSIPVIGFGQTKFGPDSQITKDAFVSRDRSDREGGGAVGG